MLSLMEIMKFDTIVAIYNCLKIISLTIGAAVLVSDPEVLPATLGVTFDACTCI